MNVTVILVTLNRMESLRRCVEALRNELLPADEIIIVSSSKACPERELLALDARIRLVESGRQLMTYQRNIGIRESKHDVVAFLDDDAFVQSGWREALDDAFCVANVSSVVGKEIIKGFERHDNPEKPRVRWNGQIIPLSHYSGNERTEVDFGQGCNMAYRKEALLDICGFDENFRRRCDGEESDVLTRLRRAGHKVIYEPGMAVIHEPASPVGYTRNAFDWRMAYYSRRNHTYFLTKHYLLRLPWFAYVFGEPLVFGWHCLRRALLLIVHSAFVWVMCLAGKTVGVCLGVWVRLRSTPQ